MVDQGEQFTYVPRGAQSPRLQLGRASSPHQPDLGFTPPGAHCQAGGEGACSVLRINVSAIQKYLPVFVFPPFRGTVQWVTVLWSEGQARDIWESQLRLDPRSSR